MPLPDTDTPRSPTSHRLQSFAALGLVGAGLVAVLHLQLLMALVSGLTVYTVNAALIAGLERRMPAHRARVIGSAVMVVGLVAVFTAIGVGLDALGFGNGTEKLVRLTELLSASVERLRASLPPWIAQHLPESVDALRTTAVDWMRGHVAELRLLGTEAAKTGAQMLVGMVVGLLASGRTRAPLLAPAPPFLVEWRHGLGRLVRAFSDVMGAQIRIAAINTALTGIYLLVVVPALGEHMPMGKTLTVLTFVVSLVPVLGNLVSNSAIVLASLLVSPAMALFSLFFLIGVHKMEYFLNARLVGGRIQARTYELLTAMLVMEAIFGLRGVAAAPVYYAWLMGLLRDEGWM